jgi:3-demethoxyubiquinol 3-hydroxylase
MSTPQPTLSPRHRYLPGDRRDGLARLLRVDHAGEYGATRIYAGQAAILEADREVGPLLRHMAEQEAEHLAAFEGWLRQECVRPSLLHPFWRMAGYALGAATALMGPKAAMACTVAVEEAIDEHYAEQITALEKTPLGEAAAIRLPDLAASLNRFRAEELEHRAIGLAHGAEKAPAYPALSTAIKAASRLAIWLAQRL